MNQAAPRTRVLPRLSRRAPARSTTVRADPARFAEVYRRHHQELYRYCRSILFSEEDARDALQSAMTRAFAALEHEERDFELRPWLFRIAHNEAISLLRARRTTTTLEDSPEIATDALERSVADREELAVLKADLLTLTDRQRGVLLMHELSGLSHEEIAQALGLAAGAVRQTMFDARSALHECRKGRAMTCEHVQRVISDGDGRALRGRGLRAHLRSCNGCRDFQAALRTRPGQLAALAPPLPLAASGMLLAHLVPGAKLTLGAGVGAASATGAGAALTGKVAVVALTAAVAAGGVAEVAHVARPHTRGADPASQSRSAPSAPAAARVRATRPSHVVAAGAATGFVRSVHGSSGKSAATGHHGQGAATGAAPAPGTAQPVSAPAASGRGHGVPSGLTHHVPVSAGHRVMHTHQTRPVPVKRHRAPAVKAHQPHVKQPPAGSQRQSHSHAAAPADPVVAAPIAPPAAKSHPATPRAGGQTNESVTPGAK